MMTKQGSDLNQSNKEEITVKVCKAVEEEPVL